MREIKFRAWDNDNDCFHCADMAEISNGYKASDFRVAIQEGQCEDPEQFSGLKDKNGKEIYEGDILLDKYGTIGLCKWVQSNWEFIDHSGNIDDGTPWEIIGNIHENPELLEGT